MQVMQKNSCKLEFSLLKICPLLYTAKAQHISHDETFLTNLPGPIVYKISHLYGAIFAVVLSGNPHLGINIISCVALSNTPVTSIPAIS